MDGYGKMHRLTLTARGDMLESVAGLTANDVVRELAFAMRATDENDPETLRWLACLCERRVDDLTSLREIAANAAREQWPT